MRLIPVSFILLAILTFALVFGAGVPVRAGYMTVVYVTDFGAKCDGTTNDSQAIQAAINSVEANLSGGIVLFPPFAPTVAATPPPPSPVPGPVTCIANGLVITGSHVTLMGAGSGYDVFTNIGSVGAVTTLKYGPTGGSTPAPLGGTLLSIGQQGVLAEQFRNSVKNLALDSNGGYGGTGLYITANSAGDYENIYATGFTKAAIELQGQRLAGDIKGPALDNRFRHIFLKMRQTYAGDGIVFDGQDDGLGVNVI